MHYKKITNSVLVEENKINYLLFSDKFGEIYIKNLSIKFSQLPTILYGHSDPIHMMKISPFNNMIISADIFGKIKVCEFPNIFNFLSVFLYKNEDIKYFEFLSNRELLVLNSEQNIHLWSLEDFQLKKTLNLSEILQTEVYVISLICFDEKFIYLETDKFYFVLEKDENCNFVKKYQIDKKREDLVKSFLFVNSDYKILGIDANGNIVNIEKINI